MIEVFILTVNLASGSFLMFPLDTLEQCDRAVATLPVALRADAECFPIEMIAPGGTAQSPMLSPIPAPRP